MSADSVSPLFAEAARQAERLRPAVWPLARLGEALQVLAERAGLAPGSDEGLVPPAALATTEPAQVGEAVGHWIDWAAGRLGIETEPVEVSVADVEDLLARGGPAVLMMQGDDGPGFLLLWRSRRRTLQLIGPDLRLQACPLEGLRQLMCLQHEAPLVDAIDRLLDDARLRSGRRAAVRRQLLRERTADRLLGHVWLLRAAAGTDLARQARQTRLPTRLGGMLALYALLYTLELTGWGLIGRAALLGQWDPAWMTAWVLLVLAMVPLRSGAGWMGATWVLDASRILKRRLLAGALQVDLQMLKRDGAGRLLGRVMESQALESLAVQGGFAVLVAVIELAFAVWLLAVGAGGSAHVALLLSWVVVTLVWSLRYTLRLRSWTALRLEMTHRLVERMVGHRTTLAQEWPDRRDATLDREHRAYLERAQAMDRASVPLAAGVPGGWTLVGLLGLVPAFCAGDASVTALAIGFGGVWMAQRALGGFTHGFTALAGAWSAWEQVGHLFRAGAAPVRIEPYLPPDPVARAASAIRVIAGEVPLVEATGLSFRYDGHAAPVLDQASLTIQRGDRLLLEGPSGGGKSTLAALLVGLRQPDAGLLLLGGLDRRALGSRWQQLATEAPQFHENHLLGAPLAFNLLMGRDWPPRPQDLAEAEQVCEELGLGDLLRRMPAGIQQVVGETGWQLSHGERSRVFLARALLQKARLTILDESFASLDPPTLRRCLDCAFRRADTLIVVAHP